MDEQYNSPAVGSEPEASGRKDTSFASEAMEKEENPIEDTKMIT
jgi:hypothetical protein